MTPPSVLEDMWVELRSGGELMRHEVNTLSRLDLSTLTPVARPSAYRGRRGYSGYWWLSSLHSSVEFSTLREVDILIQLDHSNKYSSIIHNPFRITWLSPGTQAPRSVVPAYMAVHPEGFGDVVFGRALPQRAAAHALADDAGLRLMTLDDSPTYMDNLRWLASFRFSTCIPSDASASVILRSAQRSGSFRACQRRAMRELEANRQDVLTWMCHLLWSGELRSPLHDRLLCGDTPVEVAS